MVLARKDGIAHWRRVLGPTKVSEALKKSPNSIRALFGDSNQGYILCLLLFYLIYLFIN